jgi:hypothetical protein
MRDDFNADTQDDAVSSGFGIIRTLLVAGAGLLTTFLVGTAACLACGLH